MHELLSFETLKMFSTLLALINPWSAIPFFIGLTARQTAVEKTRTIRVAVTTVVITLVVASLLGEAIISFFGISVASFRVGGGLVLLLMGLNMMSAQAISSVATAETNPEGSDQPSSNLAVVPLAIPLLAGPATISTVIIYGQQATHWFHFGRLISCAVLIGAFLWIGFRLAHPISRVLGRTGIDILTRIMGLIVAALAVEFIAAGLVQLLPGLSHGAA